MDFRSSSGRCAQSRRFAEAHPQVLIIAQARRRGRIDSIAEDFRFRAFCRIRMSTTGRFSLRRRLGTLENTSTDFLHVRIARVRFGNEVCPRPTTTGHVRSKLLVIEPGVVELTEVAVHSVEGRGVQVRQDRRHSSLTRNRYRHGVPANPWVVL